MFRSQIRGLSDVVSSTSEEGSNLQRVIVSQLVVNRGTGPVACIGPNCKMDGGASTPEADAWLAKKQQEEAARQKKLEDAKSWRQSTPIVTLSTKAPSGEAREFKVFGWNKELGLVWVDEGPRASAENSMLLQEAILASKSPEWVAWKSRSGTGSALPLLLGVAYLLFS